MITNESFGHSLTSMPHIIDDLDSGSISRSFFFCASHIKGFSLSELSKTFVFVWLYWISQNLWDETRSSTEGWAHSLCVLLLYRRKIGKDGWSIRTFSRWKHEVHVRAGMHAWPIASPPPKDVQCDPRHTNDGSMDTLRNIPWRNGAHSCKCCPGRASRNHQVNVGRSQPPWRFAEKGGRRGQLSTVEYEQQIVLNILSYEVSCSIGNDRIDVTGP